MKVSRRVLIGSLFLLPALPLLAIGLPFVAIAWLIYLASPITGFTFTDAVDFLAPGLIIASVLLIAWRHAVRPYPMRWIKFASVACFALAVATPLAPLISYYLLSYRAEAILGHWPDGTAYDPKHICAYDALYQRLYHLTHYVQAFAGWGLYTWGALMLHLRRSLTRKQLLWHIVVFIAAWMIFIYEPGGRFVWWLD